MLLRRLLLPVAVFATACSGETPSELDAGPDPRADAGGVQFPQPCPDIYADDVLPTFEVEIAPDDWEALDQETWRPAVFQYGSDVYPDARVRARGNRSVCEDLVQLAIAFHKVDSGGRFRGLRRINLDHGGCHWMNERLALSFMRDLGVPAPCANHARLVVNGEPYGIVWTSVEHVDQEFLRRQFGPDDDGNLYKHGTEPRTHESDGDHTDIETFWSAEDLGALEEALDLEQALLEWAAEATLPASGNYWSNGFNFYLYHHPTRGFLFLPNDLDGAPDVGTVDVDPVEGGTAPHYRVVIDDAAGRARYVEALREAHAAYDSDVLVRRLARWRDQIIEAVGDDPEVASRLDVVVEPLVEHVPARAEWLGTWIEQETEGL